MNVQLLGSNDRQCIVGNVGTSISGVCILLGTTN